LFVLTGSSSPLLNNQNIHSGAFRIGRVLLSTLTLTEKGTSSKKINFLDLCSENKFSELSHDKFDDIIKEICVGGWPRNIGLSADDSMENVKEYIKNVINFDSQKLSYKVKPILFERFLSSLSRNIAHDVKDATLAKDTNISDETVRNYLNVCSEMYLTKTLHV
jgi:predicted AAA+ superfamily ATPase